MNHKIIINKVSDLWVATLTEYCPLTQESTGVREYVKANSYPELQKLISDYVSEVNKNI